MIQNELFSLGNYSAPARSKRKKYSAYAADPAWEDGTAYPEIAKTNFDDNDGLISGINQECDRSQENNTACAFLEETAKTSDGDDENECERSQENNTACAFLEETSDISDDDRSQENHTVSVFLEETSDISDDDHSQENNTACAFLEETSDISDDDRSQENHTVSVFLEETSDISDDDHSQENNTACAFLEETSDISDDDRWNPKDFNSTGVFQKEQDGQLLIFLDSSEEAPDPDDYPNLNEYEQAWKEWKDKEDSSNLICAQELVQDTVSQVLPLDCNSLELPKSTTTAVESLQNDTQASKTSETSPSLSHCQKQTSSPVPLHAPHLVSEECDSVQTTRETASPLLSKSSSELDQSIVSLKTSQACSIVPSDQEPKNSTLIDWRKSSTRSDIDLRVLWFPVAVLEVDLSDKDCYWLPSPTAYSSVKSRPPGLNKLEQHLRQTGHLERGQVINPQFLEESLGIPTDWTDPTNSLTAWDFLKAIASSDDDAKPSVTLLTQDLPLSDSTEFYTSKASVDERRARGCLYKYLENKTLKNGLIVTYPRIDGERDENDVTHWRWGFNWEEKVNGEWRNRSLGCIPHRVLSMIRAMQKLDTPLDKTIEFIKNSKGRKRANPL